MASGAEEEGRARREAGEEETDEDDERPQLSEGAARALLEFLEEQGRGEGEKGGGEGVKLVAEDWRLSQFWYDECTARDLSERKNSPDVLARLLEYHERLGQYGDDFAFSRGLLSPRALPALSIRGAVVRTGGEDSLYYAGLRRCATDPYHPASNPTGVIQLGLAENHMIVQLSLDLVRECMEEHAGPATTPGGGDKERDLTISGLATYQPYDGILALKMSQECLEKVAKTVSFLAQPEGSFLLLLTGEVQKDRALELLNVCPFYFVYLCGVKT
ncbi:ACC synthase [Hordeum vulgare]|nr:ACC synthase [Hordeum vulgare]